MDSESLPPSQARPSSIMASRSAAAASYMAAPSASILAAYIQLTDAFTSARPLAAAQTCRRPWCLLQKSRLKHFQEL